MSKKLRFKKKDAARPEDFLAYLEKILPSDVPPSKQNLFSKCGVWMMDEALNFWNDPVLTCEVIFFTLARPIIKPKW